MASKISLHDPELGALTEDQLTRDYWVFQRAKGHRFSSDDIATAYVAEREAADARRIVDLGCGLGSVLLHLAWTLPEASLVGIEAQAMSFELLRRNVARNAVGDRVTIHHGDIRDDALLETLGTGFDLVTGTPPYFPPDTAIDAMDEQRAFARIEYRGGVEAYLAAGAKLLAKTPAARLVVCGDARALARVDTGARAAALRILRRCDVVAQAGKPALFSIWTLAHGELGGSAAETSALTLRDADRRPTADADRLRAFSGLAPRPAEPA